MTTTSTREPQLLRPDGGRYEFATVWDAPRTVAEQLFLRGTTPRPPDVAGWEYKGRNLGPIANVLRIRRFTKGFVPISTDETDEVIDGYNVWVKQRGGPGDAWLPFMKAGRPSRHGFYKIVRVGPGTIDSRYPHALLIDYGLGDNPWYHPGRTLRDYVVQVYEDDPRLLIGKAYVALGSSRIFGNHFVMERAARAEDETGSGNLSTTQRN